MIPALVSRTLHKWIALIVGVQALLWVVSGFYMVVVDLDFIHGDTLVRNLATAPPRTKAWFPLDKLRSRVPNIEQVRIKGLPGLDQPFYEFRTAGRVLLIDGTTGEIISPFGEGRIAALARQYYAGHGSVETIELLSGEAPLEI